MDIKYRIKVEVANSDDINEFATSVSKLESLKKLTNTEKLKILVSYPFRLRFVHRNKVIV